MSPRGPNTPRPSGLSDEDRNFVERLAEHFDVEAMTAARRAAFTAEIDARLARAKRTRVPRGVWVGTAVALAAAIVLAAYWQGSPTAEGDPQVAVAEATGPQASPPQAPAPQTAEAQVSEVVSSSVSSSDWESEIFFGSASGDLLAAEGEEDSEDFDDRLPSDYAAIGSFFLDG